MSNIATGLLMTQTATNVMSDNITAMWTSGRKCNFLNKGCDAAALQPVNINGWFWADGNKRCVGHTSLSSSDVDTECSSKCHVSLCLLPLPGLCTPCCLFSCL